MTFSEDEREAIFSRLDDACWQCGGEGVFHVPAISPLAPGWSC